LDFVVSTGKLILPLALPRLTWSQRSAIYGSCKIDRSHARDSSSPLFFLGTSWSDARLAVNNY
jgi:hypothetical protein